MKVLSEYNLTRISILLSILLHSMLMLVIQYIPKPKISEKIEVEFVDKKINETKLSQSVVRATDIPLNQITQSDEKTKFLSEKIVRVKEQTRAKLSGLTKNVAKNKLLSQALPQLHAINDLQKAKLAKQAQNTHLNSEKNLLNQINPGISTISDDLPQNIKFGDMTVLNTDQYTYYTFISRAGDAFYNEWAPLTQAILENPPVLLKDKGPGVYSTNIEVWFLPDGKIHSVHVMKQSGIPEFDFAAIKSFKSVSMIPNPPKQKIDEDGFIKFTWQLNIHYEPKALVRR